MNNFNYIKADSPDHAIQQISDRQRTFLLAGGTNIIDLWKYNLTHPDTLVDLSQIKGLKTIHTLENGGLHLGALVSNSDTAHHELVKSKYPLLSKTILAGATAQIRNSATNGGNLMQRTRCHYFYDAAAPCNKRNPGSGCPAIKGHNRMHAILGHSDQCIAVFPSDMCIALAALDAIVKVKSSRGERIIKFSDFHRLPGDQPEKDNTLENDELIIAIELPNEGFSDHYSYLKLRDRNSYAFALISVATGLVLDGQIIQKANIALGGVAHQPWRVPEAEEFLIGKDATPENFANAADIILAGAKGFEHNSFKIPLAKQAIIRNGAMALHPERQRPGAQPSL